MAATDQYTVRGNLQPCRHAARFIGGDSDDVLASAAAATSAVAAEDASGTFTAWIMIPNLTETACTIACFGDTDADELLQFAVKAGLLTLTITDGGVAQVVAQEDAVGLTPHKWHHVAVVGGADSPEKEPKFYIDGVATASTNDTATDTDEWINDQLAGLDNLTIGMAKFNNTTVQEFKGYISDVKYWDAALTTAQIKDDMKGNAVVAANLQHHWDMKDDYDDVGLRDDTLSATGDVLLVQASEFDSRLTFQTGVPVVADKVHLAINNGIGYAHVIQAA